MRISEDNAATVSAFVYTAGSLLTAAVVFAAAVVADYDWVARLGGAGWVFLLSMVILMPIVPALLRDRAGRETSKLAKDPVCGMEVDPATAAGTSEYEARSYYFCNLDCKNSFDAEPAAYAQN